MPVEGPDCYTARMASLPIDPLAPRFREALADGHVVVAAATGSGKSTRLPLWCRESGPVLVVEPRRVACTALAHFLADGSGESVGETVGYAIRFDSAWSKDTEVLFATPGIALRWLGEGRLDGFRTVMLDEFHERRWDTDLLLALLLRRDRHRLVVTSATMAAAKLGRYLEATRLEAEGRSYPVSLHHLADDPREMPDRRGIEAGVRAGVERALRETDGDVLVFLPGRGEIEMAASALGSLDVPLIPLHAGIPSREQQAALTPGRKRRIILATNVAETSLTIPGVTAVVDSGLERRTARRNNRTVLQLAPIARSNAEQRRGRAGRVAPGRCYRLWGEQAPLAEFTPPETQREELTEMMLAARVAGEDLDSLAFPEHLPEKSLAQARERLRELGAVDGEGRLTEHGRALFSLPIDAHFAHLITAMPDTATQAAMIDLTAALTTRPPLFRLPDGGHERAVLAEWQPAACDATTLIAVLRQPPPSPLAFNRRGCEEARRLARQIRAALGLSKTIPEECDFDRERLVAAAAEAAPSLAFVRRERRREAMGNGIGEVFVSEASRLEPDSEAALVFDDHSVPGRRGTRETRTVATCLAPVSLRLLARLGLGERHAGRTVWEQGVPVVEEERHYANRVIARDRRVPEGPLLREAVCRLVLEGRLLAPAGERLKADIAQWELYVRLGHGEGEVPEPADWLLERLAVLGLEEPDDLQLIEADDLVFPGIPEWERKDFDRRFPARFSLGDLKLAVNYDVRRRRITLDRLGGTRKTQPKRWELPAWQGWTIRYREGSKVVEVR